MGILRNFPFLDFRQMKKYEAKGGKLGLGNRKSGFETRVVRKSSHWFLPPSTRVSSYELRVTNFFLMFP